MGSTISSIFADIVMRELEKYVFSKMKYIKFYNRYVDELFLLIPKDKLDHTFKIFNSFDKQIQFTYEIKKTSRLKFLDTTVINKDGVCNVCFIQFGCE